MNVALKTCDRKMLQKCCHFDRREKSRGERASLLHIPIDEQERQCRYVGVTNDPERRLHERKMKMVPGFTKKYNVNKLVYFEETHCVRAAIAREKGIKKWRREKKHNLVTAVNPERKDLSDEWV